MQLNINRRYSSPNHSPRNGKPISLIVLHSTVGTFASSLNWLCNRKSGVSAHYLVDQNGDIYQLVADNRAAWHAGVARWDGWSSADIRDRSIGIELVNRTGMVGFRGQDPYPPAQVEATVRLCRQIIEQYDIALSNVVRHADIALPKRRKIDPVGFDWASFKVSLLPDIKTYKVITILPSRIRALPTTNSAKIGLLWPGSIVHGEEVENLFGEVWVKRLEGGYIRADLLKEI